MAHFSNMSHRTNAVSPSSLKRVAAALATLVTLVTFAFVLLLSQQQQTSNFRFEESTTAHIADDRPRPVDIVRQQQSDPTCATGVRNKAACCKAVCGKCGGTACYQRSKQFGTRCCSNAILNPANSLPSCDKSMPPCVISPQTPNNNGPPGTGSEPTMSTLTGAWRIAPVDVGLPIARHEACAVMVKGLLVLVGGRGYGLKTSIYNPRNRTWYTAPAAGEDINIHHFQCVAIGWSVWIPTSWTNYFPREKENKNAFQFDVRKKKWFFWPAMDAKRNRGGAAAVRRGDYIYIVAGNQGGHGAHATSLTYMDAFNWKTKTWSTDALPDMPGSGRDHVGGALVKDKLCIAGGRDGGVANFFTTPILTTYCYDFAETKWIKRADFPLGRAGAMTGATCDGRMMIAGGEGFGKAYTDVHVFDYDEWKVAPSMVSRRHGSGLGVAQCSCGHIFVPSGAIYQGGGKSVVTTTDEYIPKDAPQTCSAY